MAKISTLIEGFDSMSPEEQTKALLGLDVPETDYTGYIKKDTFDKTASELAELKRQSKAKLTEDEQKQQERDEQFAIMKGELEQLRKDKLLATTKSSYLSLGYSEALATEISQYVVDGDADKVFATQAKFLAEYKKGIEKEFTNNVPPPATGSGEPQPDHSKMTMTEKMTLKANDPDKFKQIFGGN